MNGIIYLCIYIYISVSGRERGAVDVLFAYNYLSIVLIHFKFTEKNHIGSTCLTPIHLDYHYH